jgi:exosortase/archaeosortase family protein
MKIQSIFFRYLILILAAIPNLFIFYFIFTPLTIYPLFGLFKIFLKDVVLINNNFFISKIFVINIIKACVAGSAYYLLFILNLSVPKISFKKRFKMILFSFSLFLILNILRIFILTLIVISNSSAFELIHKMLWYSGATIFVVFIWFLEVKFFKIKSIPVYSDIKSFFKLIKKTNKTKTHKKN